MASANVERKSALPVIWLDLLDEILHKWIVDVYSQDEHTGINDIPARRWKNSIVEYPPTLPLAHPDLNIILGKIDYRKISGTVIHFKNLEYSDSILATIKANQNKDERVKIKYDPTDLEMIYVYDASWSRYVPVPAIDQEYGKGLTEWQHEVICKFICWSNQARVDRRALAEAMEYIRQKIAEAFGRKPRKLKSANKIAKWMAFEDPTEPKLIYPAGLKPEKPGGSNKLSNSQDEEIRLISDEAASEQLVPDLKGDQSFSNSEIWDADYDITNDMEEGKYD